MERKEKIFQGMARVYLQGKGALQLVDKSNAQYHTYFIGSVESQIKIKDFRQEPIEAAHATIEGRSEREFADVFNQSAEIKIVDCEGNIEIELRAVQGEAISPILWMGVIDDKKMPVHNTFWEVLKSIRGDTVAFAALVID